MARKRKKVDFPAPCPPARHNIISNLLPGLNTLRDSSQQIYKKCFISIIVGISSEEMVQSKAYAFCSVPFRAFSISLIGWYRFSFATISIAFSIFLSSVNLCFFQIEIQVVGVCICHGQNHLVPTRLFSQYLSARSKC